MSAPHPAESAPTSAASPVAVARPAVLKPAASTMRRFQPAPALRPGPIDRLARRLVLLLLSRMRRGELVLVEDQRRLRFGAPDGERSLSG